MTERFKLFEKEDEFELNMIRLYDINMKSLEEFLLEDYQSNKEILQAMEFLNQRYEFEIKDRLQKMTLIQFLRTTQISQKLNNYISGNFDEENLF